MKTKQFVQITAIALLSTINHQLSTCFAQGSLTPPGAPAPTMKTLDQVEARTPITNTASLATISEPGSYYLTHNLTVSTGDGIDINTNDVTLDLNGFTIRSTSASASGTGILLNNGWSDITIGNGHIRGVGTNNSSGVFSGGGFTYGIKTYSAVPENVMVSRISVSGCRFDGISLSGQNSTEVEACTVRTVGGYGIIASTVKSSSALDCGNTAIQGDQVSDCHGQSDGGGVGVDGASVVQNCWGTSTSNPGVEGYIVQNCYGTSTSAPGVEATIMLNCYGQSSSGWGLHASTAQNCYGLSTSSDGIISSTAQNCYGVSQGSGDGLYADYTASGCYGRSDSGIGLHALIIANVCHGETFSGTALSTTHNVNSY